MVLNLTVVSLYSGECPFLQCITKNDDFPTYSPNSLASKISFCSTGVQYLLLLQGINGTSGDNYILNTEIVDSCSIPQNDQCHSAEVISLNAETSFSTNFATGGIYNCFGVDETDHSVWFRVRGTGKSLTATTCHLATQFTTSIIALKG